MAGTLSGCEGGFDLGSMFGGGNSEQAAPADGGEAAPKKPKKRRMPPKKAAKPADATAKAGAPDGAATPAASPAPALKPKAFLVRNVTYDAMRTRAMRMVYEGKTKKALASFQDAQRARPDDPAVQMWVAAIRRSAQSAREAAPTAGNDFNTAAQQLRAPVAPEAPAPVAPMAPAAGSAPTLPRPALPPRGAASTPQTVDPRLVF